MLRKLFSGLMAASTMFLMMSSLASAQEASSEEPVEQPATTVDCTMLNFTPPEERTESGNYVVNQVISLELYVPKGGAMYWYFTASKDSDVPYRLNDGIDNAVDWTPTEAGTYVVYGEFEDSKTGEPIEVKNPESCTVRLIVEDAIVPPAHNEPDVVEPPAEESSKCSDPNETLTSVPEDDGSVSYYASDGEYCGTVKAQQPLAAPPTPTAPSVAAASVSAEAAPELPHTGSGTATLAFVGTMLVLSGTALLRMQKKIAVR